MQFYILSISNTYRMFFYAILSVWVFTISVGTAEAQTSNPAAEEIAQNALKKAVRIYDLSLGKNSFIYTGRSYHEAYGGIRGHQFFVEDYWEQGNVNFDGHEYDSIYLRYDTYKDQLIIENFNLNGMPSPIIVYGPKVNFFELFNHHFIRMEKDTITNFKEGYYDLMHQGDSLSVLIKRRKELTNSTEINTIREMFTEKDRYFIIKNDLAYQVKSKKSIMKVLEDRKKEIKKYIKTNGVNFKPVPDQQLVEVVKYYESML